MAPVPPSLHFPSPYERPHAAPAAALHVPAPDGAQIAAFVYAPDGVRDEPGTPFAIDRSVPPVVLLHGNGEEHGIFGPTIDAVVATGRSVVAIDSRAQGRSTRGTAPLTYELMASDALAVLARLGVTLFHVLGFSDGGIEALILARDCPKRVLSLVAMGANLCPEGVDDGDWDVEGTARSLREWADWLDSLGDAGPVDPTLLVPDDTAARTNAELLQLMVDEPHIDPASLSSVRCPATVVVGEFDCIRPWQTRQIVGGLRSGGNDRVRQVTVPGCDHTIPKHEPLWCTDVLQQTVAQNDLRLPVAGPARPTPGIRVARVDGGWVPELEALYDRVDDAEERSGTSGWVRGVWPPEGLAARYARESLTWCAFDEGDVERDGTPRPGAHPLGAVSLDLDDALDGTGADWPTLPAGASLTMHLLAVDPAARGSHVGETLVSAAVAEARRRGCTVIRINTAPENVPANVLYHRCGFSLHRPIWNPYPGLPLCGWTNLWELGL